MTTLSTTAVIRSVVDLLTEAYEGPPDPSATWFIDNEPDSGIFGILNGISAAEASNSVVGSGESGGNTVAGTSIAAHAEHLRWSLEMMNAAIRGEPLGDWKESWQVLEADEAEWESLRSALRAEFETLRGALLAQTEIPEAYLPGLFALLPHAAYHLGTIRQMIERVKA